MPADHDGIGQVLAGCHPQSSVVEIGAAAALGGEQVLGDRVVDHPGNDIVAPLQGNRYGEMGNAVDEIGGAVDRVDDPAVLTIGSFDGALFFH